MADGGAKSPTTCRRKRWDEDLGSTIFKPNGHLNRAGIVSSAGGLSQKREKSH